MVVMSNYISDMGTSAHNAVANDGDSDSAMAGCFVSHRSSASDGRPTQRADAFLAAADEGALLTATSSQRKTISIGALCPRTKLPSPLA